MIVSKENEEIQEEITQEEYDYMNEEPLEEDNLYDDGEEIDYCD